MTRAGEQYVLDGVDIERCAASAGGECARRVVHLHERRVATVLGWDAICTYARSYHDHRVALGLEEEGQSGRGLDGEQRRCAGHDVSLRGLRPPLAMSVYHGEAVHLVHGESRGEG